MEQRIILSVLSDLEKEEKPTLKEQPVCEELGKELENYARLHPFEDSGSYRNMIQLAHHFAKWGAEHAKEELMKEAVEVVGVAIWQYLDNLGRDFYKIETEEFTTHGEISEGDKVRIIIVKED